PTGEISDETLELINKPRCGVEIGHTLGLAHSTANTSVM
ncbi:uncharacterized protein LOC126456653, partial [Schistocerca serialis cubense]